MQPHQWPDGVCTMLRTNQQPLTTENENVISNILSQPLAPFARQHGGAVKAPLEPRTVLSLTNAG